MKILDGHHVGLVILCLLIFILFIFVSKCVLDKLSKFHHNLNHPVHVAGPSHPPLIGGPCGEHCFVSRHWSLGAPHGNVAGGAGSSLAVWFLLRPLGAPRTGSRSVQAAGAGRPETERGCRRRRQRRRRRRHGRGNPDCALHWRRFAELMAAYLRRGR